MIDKKKKKSLRIAKYRHIRAGERNQNFLKLIKLTKLTVSQETSVIHCPVHRIKLFDHILSLLTSVHSYAVYFHIQINVILLIYS
jgi:hypothetical protein